jgi:hypothetical protein
LPAPNCSRSLAMEMPALPAPIWHAIIKRLGAHAQSNI